MDKKYRFNTINDRKVFLISKTFEEYIAALSAVQLKTVINEVCQTRAQFLALSLK